MWVPLRGGEPSGDPAHVQTTKAVPSEEHQEGTSQAGLGPDSGYSCDVVHESVSLFMLVSSAEAIEQIHPWPSVLYSYRVLSLNRVFSSHLALVLA